MLVQVQGRVLRHFVGLSDVDLSVSLRVPAHVEHGLAGEGISLAVQTDLGVNLLEGVLELVVWVLLYSRVHGALHFGLEREGGFV